MQGEIEYKDKEYHYLPHKGWCGLLFTMDAKYNRYTAVSQTKRLAPYKAVQTDYDINESAKIPLKNKENTGILPARQQQGRKNLNHKCSQHICVL